MLGVRRGLECRMDMPAGAGAALLATKQLTHTSAAYALKPKPTWAPSTGRPCYAFLPPNSAAHPSSPPTGRPCHVPRYTVE